MIYAYLSVLPTQAIIYKAGLK